MELNSVRDLDHEWKELCAFFYHSVYTGVAGHVRQVTYNDGLAVVEVDVERLSPEWNQIAIAGDASLSRFTMDGETIRHCTAYQCCVDEERRAAGRRGLRLVHGRRKSWPEDS